MKAIKLSLCLAVLSLGTMAQNNIYPTAGNPTIYEYSPSIFLQRNNSEGGYTQGIQTRLFDGTNNWFFGNLHDGQWMVAKGDYTNPKLVVLSNGNVGIGTLSPNSALEIFKGSTNEPALTLNSSSSGWGSGLVFKNTSAKTFGIYSGSDSKLHFADESVQLDRMVILGNGYTGIGTTVPTEKLSVYGTANSEPGVFGLESARNDAMNVEVGSIRAKNSDGEVARIGLLRGSGTYTGVMNFMVRPTNNADLQEAMRIAENGNIGIGTTTPNEKLAVNGKVRAKEIKVETANWPDYVFEEGYQVGTLQELESYIKTNKHLPDMPSAKEAEANGIELGEMNKLLLKKVEELTLHLIEKDKELTKNKEVIKSQSERLQNLEERQEKLDAILKKLIGNK